MIVDNNNITDIYPEFKNIKQRIARLTVWNLDGTTSEMKFYYPPFCWNGDDSSRIGVHLEEWCREMTRFYLKIVAYQVDFGVQYQDGTEKIGGMSHFKEEVPEGKIYRTGNMTGKWMTPEKLNEEQRKKQCKWMDKNMRKGYQATSDKHRPHKPRVGSKIYLN